MTGKVQHNKGKIRDNALKALVKSDLFRHKVERKRKGKGSYNRQEAKKWLGYSLAVIHLNRVKTKNRMEELR